MVCTACAADVPDEDVFCENCGVRLGPEPAEVPGCACGAGVDEVDEDGFCLRCGKRVRRPASDHVEESLTAEFAAVSDRGLRHERNEDRFALVQGEAGFGVAVCDGVSATQNPEEASGAVSACAGRVLSEALAGSPLEPETVLRDAIAQAVAELQTGDASAGESAASTTLVSAVVCGREATVAWVGDSRAYWIDADGARLLTRDHSWRNMVLAQGVMSESEADASPQAHAITRWLGPDAGEAAEPEFARHQVSSDGLLLLCTDGLWNYAPTEDAVTALLQDSGEKDALAIAQELVAFANEQGGRDNVTVAVLRLHAPQ